MRFHDKNITVLAVALLVVLLCLPVYGPYYFSEYLGTVDTNHAEFVCSHDQSGDASGQESQDGHQQPAHCHELDVPCDMASVHALDYSPSISALTSSDKGALLDGYRAPFEIPPEHLV